MANYTSVAGDPAYPRNDPAGFPGNGGSAAVAHLGAQLCLAPTNLERADAEGIFMAEIDVGAVRRMRETPRGASLCDPPLYPALCELVKAEGYVDVLGQRQGIPGYASVSRVFAAL